MGFLDILVNALEVKDEKLELFLYRRVHDYFNLPSDYALKNGISQQKAQQTTIRLPIETRWSNGHIKSFKFHAKGPILPNNIRSFMRYDEYNICVYIDRSMNTPNGKRYAYDFSQIQQGVFAATLLSTESPEMMLSDETRTFLDILNKNVHQRLTNVPLVQITFGELYYTHGIPQHIYIQAPVESGRLRLEETQSIVDAYLKRYSIVGRTDVKAEFVDHKESAGFILKAELIVVPEPAMTPEPPQQKPSSTPSFPYDYYRSIGLIDNENMVLANSVLGQVRVPADSDQGREALLMAGQS